MDATTDRDLLTQAEAPTHSHKVGALSILWVWVFYFVLNTARMALAGADHQLAMAARRAAVVVVGVTLTAALYLLLHRLERARMGLRLFVAFTVAAPVAFAHAAFNYYAFYVFAPLQFWPAEMTHKEASLTPLAEIISTGLDWYFFIAAWAALYIALSNATQARLAERQASLYRAQAQAAQLRALRYQLNPHFLFNTLNSLSTLVLRETPQQAEQMIATLAAFLRATLATDPTEDTTLADEVRVQRLYLDIEQVRFPDRLRVEIDIPDHLLSARVPSLLLQPLVENAIKYGVARTTRPVTIAIRAGAVGGTLNIAVSDDGAAGTVHGTGYGVGLRNVCARLRTRYGADTGCTYGALPGGGFRVDLRMPLEREAIAAE